MMTLDEALSLIDSNAFFHRHREPTLGTLLEEISEYVRATEGKHSDHPGLELVQIGGIVANLLRRYDYDSVLMSTRERETRREVVDGR